MQTLRLLVDVARCRSMSHAAALHGITQSAASQRIRQLEKKLNVTLIDRSVRPLALTNPGQTFVEELTELLGRYDNLERRVGAIGDPGGRVQLAAIYSAGIDLLDHLREEFVQAHAQIRVEIKYVKPDEVYRQVQERECDIGILSYPKRWRKVEVIRLRDEAMAVVCSPEHAIAKLPRVRAADLTAFAMASFDMDLPVGRQIRQYLKDNGGSPQVINLFDNIDTIKHAITVTDCFSILPSRTVRRELEIGSLVAVKLIPRMTRPLGLIFRKHVRAGEVFGPAVQMFVDHLLKHAGPNADVADVGVPHFAVAGVRS